MASFFLIVGVGGGGRGVLNHLKYELEREYGLAEKARVRLVCIDGPERDQYVLPGEFQIDTSPASPEFIQTEISPATVIQNIAKGQVGTEEKYIAPWLLKGEANKIPTTALNPLTGLGGERVPGHAMFYLQLDDLQRELLRAYNQARSALGEKPNDRVVVVLVGSLSGGTGAGLLWDIAHLLRGPVAANHDPLVGILPLPNTYHPLMTSEGEKIKLDAKNFAGIRELMRFMAARPELPTRMIFSDTIAVENDRLFDVPFILDGDRMNSKVNDVIPQSGIVPAIADFLLAVVKDNLAGTCPIYNNLVNWGMAHIGGAPTDIERFGAFGTSSIRYPSYEILGSFAYRFAYEIYETILEPRGEAVGAGALLATKTLNDCPLTTMVENPATARTAPGEYRQLSSKVSTGRTGSLPFPVRGRLTEEVKYGRSLIFWTVSDAEVIQNAETFRNLYLGKETDLASNTVRGWMNLQARKIIDLFFGTEKFESEKDLGLVEQEIFRLFIKKEGELLLPNTLYESPHAIVIARDYLKALKDRFDAFAEFWDSRYKQYLYPEGEGKPSLIARQIEAVDKKRGAMQGDEEELQEAYLLEAQRLLDLEVWNILMKGIGDLIEVMRNKISRLWALIGDDADGWVNILGRYRDLMERKYSDDITRRTQFTALKLRKYLSSPGGPAEDWLFEEVADPILHELFREMHWSFAVDPKDPDRYKLVLVSPEVSGYQYQAYEGILLNVFTRDRLRRINHYNPYQHVQYAKNTLRGPLELKTIWDLMWYEYEHEWRRRPENAEKGLEEYVEEQIDWLLDRSEVLLNYTSAPNLHEESYLFSKFLTAVETSNPSHFLAAQFTSKVDQRNIQRTDDDLYTKEIRLVNVELKIPLTNWASYQDTLERYRKYHEVPTNTLVHIYPNEQNAFKVEGLIAQKVERAFGRNILDPSVASLLDDFDLFETFALCLVDGRIPIKKVELGAPSRYALTLPGGEADLGEVWDVDTLVSKVWGDEEVQGKLAELWRARENEVQSGGKVEEFLKELEAKLKAFAFPSPPSGENVKMNLAHLKLAFRAVIGAYIEKVRQYR